MQSPATPHQPDGSPPHSAPTPKLTGVLEELARLRQENRRLAISLGGFSAFLASRGLLEEAWTYIHRIHQLEDGDSD